MKIDTPTTLTPRPATVTGRQSLSAAMVNAARVASAHRAAPATITGRGSRSAAGNSGGAFSAGRLFVDISFTVTDQGCAYVGGVQAAEDRDGDGLVANVIDITDPADARVDDFRHLNSVDRRPDLPTGKGLVIAEGVLVVQRMLASRFTPHAFLGTDRRLQELAADLAGVAVPYYRASAEVMAEIVGFHLNRGVLAAARRPAELGVADVLTGASTVAVLEGVNDHENLGSIFRNAAGLGVDAVVFGAGCADPLYRRAVRVSMGHALLVPFARAGSWPADLNIMRDNGFRLLAMTPSPQARTLSEVIDELSDEKVAVLVGAEGPGLTETALRAADARVRIPMARGTDSLNVATAAALAFYERVRRVDDAAEGRGGGGARQ